LIDLCHRGTDCAPSTNAQKRPRSATLETRFVRRTARRGEDAPSPISGGFFRPVPPRETVPEDRADRGLTHEVAVLPWLAVAAVTSDEGHASTPREAGGPDRGMRMIRVLATDPKKRGLPHWQSISKTSPLSVALALSRQRDAPGSETLPNGKISRSLPSLIRTRCATPPPSPVGTRYMYSRRALLRSRPCQSAPRRRLADAAGDVEGRAGPQLGP